MLNDSQYHLLDEFQKVNYLLFASTAEMEFNGLGSAKFKKYIVEIDAMKKKYSNIKYAKYSLNFFEITYYQYNSNYKNAIQSCNEILEDLDASDILLKSRMYYNLGNIYSKTNERQLALKHYKDALFYFNSIDQYNYSSLVTEHKIFYFQMLISNFFNKRYEFNNGDTKNSFKVKANFNRIKLNIDAIKDFLVSQIDKQENINLIDQNKNLQFQKIQQELSYKSIELERNRLELQKALAFQKVSKQKQKIKELKINKQYYIFLTAFLFIIVFLISYFLWRLHKKNMFIKQQQNNKDRFFTILSHDLRSVITNLKDSGEVMNYLIKSNRLLEIQDISKKLDWDGCHALLLLNNMLDWGTLTHYSYQPTYSNFLISNKIWKIIGFYQSAMDSKSIQLNMEIENDLCIYSDEKSIDIILRNIIANAKAHTQEEGNITIRLEKHHSNQIVLIVTNSVNECEQSTLVHIQNIFSGKEKPMAGNNGIGLGMVLIDEFAKNCDISLAFSFENNKVTCKTFFYLT